MSRETNFSATPYVAGMCEHGRNALCAFCQRKHEQQIDVETAYLQACKTFTERVAGLDCAIPGVCSSETGRQCIPCMARGIAR